MPKRKPHHPRRRQPARPDRGHIDIPASELRVQPSPIMRAPLHLYRLAFEPADRFPHRRLAGLDHRALHPWIVGDGVEHAG